MRTKAKISVYIDEDLITAIREMGYNISKYINMTLYNAIHDGDRTLDELYFSMESINQLISNKQVVVESVKLQLARVESDLHALTDKKNDMLNQIDTIESEQKVFSISRNLNNAILKCRYNLNLVRMEYEKELDDMMELNPGFNLEIFASNLKAIMEKY